MIFTRRTIRSAAVFLAAVLALSGCSMLFPEQRNPIPPSAQSPETESAADPVDSHVFTLVDHYVGVHELADAAIALACMPPEETWTQQEADARWRMAELLDASGYPSKLLATQTYLEDANRWEKFLIDVPRTEEATAAAARYCDVVVEQWDDNVARQEAACVDGPASSALCWSRDLTGEPVSAPTAPLDLATYRRPPVEVTADYVGVHELAAAVVAVECSPPERTWTASQAQAIRDLAALFHASEFPSGLLEEQNYLELADRYDKYLIDVERSPESKVAAGKACDYATGRWAAEVERQEKACAPGAPGVPVCWSRDLAEK